MNRKNLTAAILAGLAGAAGIVGSAQAVNINPDGLGQVLLYPYYTTNGGNNTILSVVNTSSDAKAVKVRFLEGENSREVLDFNLYMSMYDVWTAALVDMDGTPTMVTNDTSCTVPYIYGNGGVQEFLPWALNDAEYHDLDPDGNPSEMYGDISRGAEGHFEIIEMGTLVDSEVANKLWVDTDAYPICDQAEAPGHPADCAPPELPRNWYAAELDEPEFLVAAGSATAATHVDGVPKDCQQLVDAWTRGAESKDDGYWIDNNFTDIELPSGGLFGGAAVINVEAGTMYSYDAKAIDGFYVAEGTYVGDDSHQEPGTILPSLDSGNSNEAAIFWNGETLESDDLDRSVDAISFVLMRDAIMNEYTTESIVGAGTEWVVTFPTKQFYVHQQFLNGYADYRDNGELDGSATEDPETAARAPFTSTWTWVNTTYETDDDGVTTVKKPGYVDYACEVVQLDTIYDREEQTIVDPELPPGTPVPPIVSPPPPGPIVPDVDGIIAFELCYETSVIAFGTPEDIIDETLILGSRNFHNIDSRILGFEYGWARLDMSDATSDIDQDGDLDELHREDLGGLYGLPVTGFAVQRFQNSFLGGGGDVLANYGGIFRHKGTRSITSAGYVAPEEMLSVR